MEKNTRNLNIISSLLNVYCLILAFLMPIFFLTVTPEFFEFNKLTLLAVSTAVAGVLWAAKIVVSQKIGINKSAIDLPLMLFMLVTVVSSVFSLDKTSSVFGSYGRWFPSLYGTLTLVLFYYVVSSNVRSEALIKRIMSLLLVSVSISTVVSILSYYGLYISSQPFMRITNFTLTGSVTTSVILAALGAVLSFAWLLHAQSPVAKIALKAAVVVNFLYIVLVHALLGWSLLVLGALLVVLYTGLEKIKENRVGLVILGGIVVAILLVSFAPFTRKIVVNKDYPKELRLGATESWIVSSSAMRDFPILGTGPSSFYLNFPRYRPVFLNESNLWNIRFDKPYNELFNVIGTLGIVGIFAFLLLIVKSFRMLTAKEDADQNFVGVSLKIGGLLLLLASFFTYATVLNSFLFFLFLALLAALRSENREDANGTSTREVFSLMIKGSSTEYYHYVIVTPIVALALVGMFFTYRMYLAEYYMRKAIEYAVANDGAKVYEYQAKAINVYPRRDSYHNAFAQTNLLLAVNLASKQDLSDAEKETLQTLIAQAIRSTRLVTESINPLNVYGWETRGGIYKAILGVAQDADQWAVSAYNTAIQLDPSNPRLRLDLGGIYYAKDDFLNAASFYRQATSLKQDYANAYYNFAQALVKLKEYDNARRALEIVQRLVPEDSEDYKRVSEEVESLKGMAAGGKPTVEEISTKGGVEDVSENQEPISNVAEESTPSLGD